MESNPEPGSNEKNCPLLKNTLKYENVTKSFDIEEVDDIIKSFDVMDGTVEFDVDRSSTNGQESSQRVIEQKNPEANLAQNSLNKLRLSKTFKARSRKTKQGRAQVGIKQKFYIYV